MRSRYPLAVLVLLGAVLAHPGRASDLPDPSTSVVPRCLTACPAGDMPFTVLVRNILNEPVVNASVVIDLSTCPAFTVCTPKPSDPYVWDPVSRFISASTDAAGNVIFFIRGGSVCDAAHTVRVLAKGVPLAILRTVASPDQNGDLIVDGTDNAIVTGKLGSADPTADFDCDGTVTMADVAIFQSHYPHACAEPTKAEGRSWGGLKLIYR